MEKGKYSRMQSFGSSRLSKEPSQKTMITVVPEKCHVEILRQLSLPMKPQLEVTTLFKKGEFKVFKYLFHINHWSRASSMNRSNYIHYTREEGVNWLGCQEKIDLKALREEKEQEIRNIIEKKGPKTRKGERVNTQLPSLKPKSVTSTKGFLTTSKNILSLNRQPFLGPIVISQIPGLEKLCKKKELGYACRMLEKVYPLRRWGNPETFILPEELNRYTAHHSQNPKKIYIAKSSSSCQGLGIRVLLKPADLPTREMTKTFDQCVIQEYVDRPLLVEGLKQDLRLYVLIASVDPLVVYLNDEGLARFCTSKYHLPSIHSKFDANSQLTNYAVNKGADNFVHTDELLEENSASKRTLASYWKSVEKIGLDVGLIKEKIEYLAQHVAKALKPHLKLAGFQKYGSELHAARLMHVIGMDVILDEDGEPWLLELNAMPSMAIDFDPQGGQPQPKTYGEKKYMFQAPKPEPETETSLVDLYVKSQVIAHGVQLCCTHSVKELLEIPRFHSYKQIFSPAHEEKLFGTPSDSLIDKTLDLYLFLINHNSSNQLTVGRASKLAGLVKPLKKIDIEMKFKQMVPSGGALGLIGFFVMLESLVQTHFSAHPESSSRAESVEHGSEKLLRFFNKLNY